MSIKDAILCIFPGDNLIIGGRKQIPFESKKCTSQNFYLFLLD